MRAPRAARIVFVSHHLARTIGLGLLVEQLRVNAVALDETVNPIAPAPAALVARDVEHVEIADQIAECDRAFTRHSAISFDNLISTRRLEIDN